MASILEEYARDLALYEDLSRMVDALLNTLLTQTQLKVHQVTSRVKSRNSLERKLGEKPQKYQHLTDVTDICALRVILYFEDDVDRVAEVIEREFHVDRENTVDKRKRDGDQFGYQSLQYVVSHHELRESLTEYKPTAGIRFEVQIRSILQHAWAEIEHGLGYHGSSPLPGNLRRRFARIAALLEVADSEFVDLRKQITRTKETIKGDLRGEHGGPTDLGVDRLTLEMYVRQSDLPQEVDREVAAAAKSRIEGTLLADLDIIARGLLVLDLNTIAAVEQALSDNRQHVVSFAKAFLSSPASVARGTTTLPSGVSLGYLSYYLIAKLAESAERKKAVERMFESIDPALLNRDLILQEFEQALHTMG